MFDLGWWFSSPKELKLGSFWGLIATIGKIIITFGALGLGISVITVVTGTTGEDTPEILRAGVGIVLAVVIAFIGRGVAVFAYHMAARRENVIEVTNKTNSKKSLEDFCFQCVNYDTGFCDHIHENVRLYSKKFIEKCNGKYFSESGR
jgi:NhaP-type Na+/H+ or K+/H+ antiporter